MHLGIQKDIALLKIDWHLTTNDTREAIPEEDCELKVNCALCHLF